MAAIAVARDGADVCLRICRAIATETRKTRKLYVHILQNWPGGGGWLADWLLTCARSCVSRSRCSSDCWLLMLLLLLQSLPSHSLGHNLFDMWKPIINLNVRVSVCLCLYGAHPQRMRKKWSVL